MPQLIFTFTMNSETKKFACAGNITPTVALRMLPQIVIAEALQKQREELTKIEKPASVEEEKAKEV